ncbi:translin-associated factor X-interacting protein 1 [Caloenas nicobarica]|uniref:translin-associated factor X-interacting protein 1 n=1 Tax=Caloenas nicobarica TaxID=187106 RepID=UPI0032B74DE8
MATGVNSAGGRAMAARRAPPGGTGPDSPSETPDCQTRINSLKHVLSKKQKTPSLQLSVRGHWSTWPAFVAGQTVLKNHKPCCAPEERQPSNKQALPALPKPRYLEQLESYLRKELQSLDLTKENSQELKLQPYREIFDFFIDSFKTYKPLLAAIKSEYEATLAHQQKTIRALEPLKAMVATVSEECTQQILALQEKERDEINMLKQEKKHLLKFIDNMKEENNSLQTQVEHLRESVTEEYAHYLNEHAARKLLLAKLNDMHNEQLEMTQQAQRRESADLYTKGEDTVKLSLALKVARQDLTKAQEKLNLMIAYYADVVPRRDFESLEKKNSDLLQEIKTLQKDFDQLHREYETLLDIQRETAEERDKFCAELQRVQHNCTPRPNWAKCSEVIPGGADRWDWLAEGKTSDQLVDVLLEEIGTRVLKEINAFHGKGKSDKVPVYLRHEGKVKNKKPTKKDVVNILKDIWKEKIALDQQTGKRSSLPEFFLSYLQKKYGNAAAMEWSYSLYENMRLCRSNHVLSSFYDILTGKVGEEQFHGQNQVISDLQKELAACDSSDSGSLTSEQFSTAVREAFPLKKKESIQELVDASRSKLDSTEDLIDYMSLFKEDEEGNPDPFVAKLRSQYVREKHKYLRQLKNKLRDLTEVNADDLKTAFRVINPDIDDQTLDTYVGLAFQVQREGPAQEVVPVETALERLLAGDVRRVGPLHREKGTTGVEGDIHY